MQRTGGVIRETNMDRGLIRGQRPTDRRLPSRPQPTYRPPVPPQPEDEAPQPVQQAAARHYDADCRYRSSTQRLVRLDEDAGSRAGN